MTLKLEVGKRYRTRSGEVITISRLDDTKDWPYRGYLPSGGGGTGWTVGGLWLDGGIGRHNDLVSEIPEPKEEPKPMVKMVVRDEKPKEQVIEWHIEQDGADVNVCANGTLVFRIRPDGKVMRGVFARRVAGLKTDDGGRIVMRDD